MKPIKSFKLAGKPIKVYNNKPIPSRRLIKTVYDKLPDNKKIPVKFMTRSQYLKSYIKAQEKKNNIDFTPKEEQRYIKKEMKEYKNYASRFTGYQNPYAKPSIVVFNDNKIKPSEFKKMASHEMAHERLEKKGKSMGGSKEEYFCDKVAHDFTKDYHKKEYDFDMDEVREEVDKDWDRQMKKDKKGKKYSSFAKDYNTFSGPPEEDGISKNKSVKGKLTDSNLLRRTWSDNYEGDSLLLPYGHSQSINRKFSNMVKLENDGIYDDSYRDEINKEVEFRKNYKEDLTLIKEDGISKNKYLVYDRKTNKTVGKFNNIKRARNKVDKLDNEYGGYNYGIKEDVISKNKPYYRGVDENELNLLNEKGKLEPHGKHDGIWVTPSRKIAEKYNSNVLEMDLEDEDITKYPGRSKMVLVKRPIMDDEISRNMDMTNIFKKNNNDYPTPPSQSYKCKVCPAEFKTLTELQWHILMKHPKR